MAALVGPVAAAPQRQPIHVAVQATQPDGELVVVLDAAEDLVVFSPFLLWKPAPAAQANAAPTVMIPLFVALRAFIRRCRRGPNPPDMAMARQTSIFGLALVPAAWTRILSELRDSGLLASAVQSLLDLDRRIDSLTLTNPANLYILPADLYPVDPFNPPPIVAPAGRGRGRGRGVGQPPPAVGVPVAAAVVAGPAELRFLQLCSLFRLEDPSSQSPLAAAALLAGMLGPCSTAPSRADEMATVRTTALILRPNLATSMGLDSTTAAGAAADPALASRLPNFIRGSMQALGIFRSSTADESDLQQEAFASFRYFLGDESQKIAVEAMFISLVQSEYASAPPHCVGHAALRACLAWVPYPPFRAPLGSSFGVTLLSLWMACQTLDSNWPR